MHFCIKKYLIEILQNKRNNKIVVSPSRINIILITVRVNYYYTYILLLFTTIHIFRYTINLILCRGVLGQNQKTSQG